MVNQKIIFATLHVRRSAQAVPLAAGCLAAALPDSWRQQALLLDLFPEQTDEQICRTLLEQQPQVVAFPLYLWNRQRVAGLVRLLRQLNPGLFILGGGPEGTAQASELLTQAPFSAVIRGEGELALAAWLEGLDTPEEWHLIAGLSWRDGETLHHGPDHGPIDLNELPSPWLTGQLRPTPEGGVLWEVARGCPFACAFCFDAAGCHQLRPLPRKRLVAELEQFVARGVSQIWVLDSTFNYPPERGIQLLQLLHNQAPQLHYHLEAKADFLDRRTARLLAELNCSLQVGLQSAHPEVLRGMNRPFDRDRFEHALHLLASEGVTYGLDLIYGLPGDSYRGFCDSLGFALEHAPNQLDIFPLAVLPGTTVHARQQEFGLQAEPEPPYTLLASEDFPAEELSRCRDLAAAVDLFYNLGRAVAFLPALLTTLELAPVEFFTAFFDWARDDQGIYPEVLRNPDLWQPAEVVTLQESFIQQLLIRRGREDLWPAANDLIRYHYHYAETLLGNETLPALPSPTPSRTFWTRRWRLAEGVRLVPFSYEVVDLLELEGADLEEFTTLFRPVGSVALYLRRGNEVICESLQEDFIRLLRGCDGRQTPEQIFAGAVNRREGEELLEFAISEGLLVKA